MKTKPNKTQRVKAAQEAIAKTKTPTTSAATTTVPANEITAKKTKKLEKDIAAQAVNETIGTREPKYQYPADCVSKEQKKSFRRAARAKLQQLKNSIEKLQSENKAAESKNAIKEANDWVRITYAKPETVEFS